MVMIGQFARFTMAFAALAALSACEMRVVDQQLRDVATYYDDARRTPEDGTPIAIAGTYEAAFEHVLGKLQAKNFQIISADAESGVIIARSANPKLIACGELQSGPLGVAALYAANAPVAIIEVPAEGSGATFVRREFISASEITIQISADPAQDGAVFASISEIHNATIRMTQLTDGSVFYNQTIAFDGINRERFDRGVTCGSARAVRATIR